MELLGTFSRLLTMLFWPGVIFLIWFLARRNQAEATTTVRKPQLTPQDGLFGAHLSGGSSFIVIVLVVALMAMGERILYDLGRTFSAEVPYSYWNSLSTIITHSLVIIPALIISIIINIAVGNKGQKYALVLIPYFMASVLLAIQLVLQISVYFYNHHTDLQFYLVMFSLIMIGSYAIYFIQNLYNKKLQEMRKS